MTLKDMVDTLAVPIQVELYDVRCALIDTRLSSQLFSFNDFKVLRWWPESREKIVVFIDMLFTVTF